MAILPIPTTRSSDLLSQTRLLGQLQSDELGLLKLQTQLSSGLRIQTPSEDASAALRAQGIQRLLELKGQIRNNLSTSQSYVDSTDTAISSVAQLLSEARSIALSSAGSTADAAQRSAAAAEVDRLLQQLLAAGNQQFRGRYLFAGSRTNVTPFELVNHNVVFNGNTGVLRSYADNDLPFDTSIDGDAMFGALSTEPREVLDLNPVLTENTRLVDLNGGRGVTKGSFLISDGASSRSVDISSATTIGDVAALLESNPPAGRTVTARVGAQGLIVRLDSTGGGELSVREVGGGTTAAELGIKTSSSIGTGPLEGDDLDPILRATTSLSDVLGVRARAYVASTGTNNDLVIEAIGRGTVDNNVAIQYVDDATQHAAPGLAAGNETVTFRSAASAATAALTFSGFNNNLLLTGGTTGTSLNNVQITVDNAGAIGNDANVTFDSVNRILHVGVDSTGATQVQTVINRINAEGTFTAAYDSSDATDGGFLATATVSASDAGVVRGNTSNSGGAANSYFVAVQRNATTADDALRALENSVAFNSRFTVRLDDKDTSSPQFEGQGFISLDAAGITSGGAGEDLDLASGIRITAAGESYDIDVSSAVTVEELLNIINGSGAKVLAEIDAAGRGINIRSRLSGADLSIGENGGTTATQLGVRSFTSGTELAALNHGAGVGTSTAGTADFVIHRNDGVDLSIDLSSAQTIGDVLDAINNHASNTAGPSAITARLARFGNGIELVDSTADAVRSTSVEASFGSRAAYDLGLVAEGSTTAVGTVSGSESTLTGADRSSIEVRGAFTALVRLREALTSGDETLLQRADVLLNDAFETVTSSRAEIGARSKTLDLLRNRLDEEELELKQNLSNEIDVDFVTTVSELQARQAAYQATLQLTGQVFRLSLLDFL